MRQVFPLAHHLIADGAANVIAIDEERDKAGRSIKGRSWVLLRRFIELTGLKPIALTIRLTLVLATVRRRLRSLKSKYDITTIVLSSDRVFGAEIVALSERLGFKNIIIPFTVRSYPEIMIKVRKGDRLFDLERMRPARKWLTRMLGGKGIRCGISYYVAEELLAMRLNGYTPDNPWILGGSNKTTVFSDNNEYKDFLVKNDVDPEKIRVVGDFSTAQIAQLKRNRNDPEKLAATISIPQLYEQGICSLQQVLDDMKAVLNVLREEGWEVFVHLHPHMMYEDYSGLETDGITKLRASNIENSMSKSEIFIGQFSNIVVWASELGMQSIILDFYKKGYNWFDELSNVQKSKNLSDFKECLKLAGIRAQERSDACKIDYVTEDGIIDEYRENLYL